MSEQLPVISDGTESSVDTSFGALMKKYLSCSTKGRATRGEYWWTTAYLVLINLTVIIPFIVVLIVSAIIRNGDLAIIALWVFGIMLGLWYLVCIVPSVALSIRRFHDVGISGIVALLFLGFDLAMAFVLFLLYQALEPNPNELSIGLLVNLVSTLALLASMVEIAITLAKGVKDNKYGVAIDKLTAPVDETISRHIPFKVCIKRWFLGSPKSSRRKTRKEYWLSLLLWQNLCGLVAFIIYIVAPPFVVSMSVFDNTP